MFRSLAAALLLVLIPLHGETRADDLRSYLKESGLPPHDYVLRKLSSFPIVILGEGHWIRHDVELVRGLVPDLAMHRVTLAMETLPASEQPRIDRLLTEPEWDPAAAMAIMRTAAWPEREYLEILHAAWQANRNAPSPFRLLALGPPMDWRQSLEVTYEQFMAERVAAAVERGERTLVYAGHHHAFTRYEQPELDLKGYARAFMERMGNLLHRRYGERVFLITLHRPLWCGAEPWSYCLPAEGRIDCAAAANGTPVGFDLAGSPLAGDPLGTDSYYAHGYPSLRMIDFSDGWIWTRPVEQYEMVTLIPLEEFAPDAESLAEVLSNNPFADQMMTVDQLRALWRDEEKSRKDPLARRGWTSLQGWRDSCR